MLEFQDLFYDVLIVIEIAAIISFSKKELEGQKLRKKINTNNQFHNYFWSSIKGKKEKIDY